MLRSMVDCMWAGLALREASHVVFSLGLHVLTLLFAAFSMYEDLCASCMAMGLCTSGVAKAKQPCGVPMRALLQSFGRAG